jgi:hypothetical protein
MRALLALAGIWAMALEHATPSYRSLGFCVVRECREITRGGPVTEATHQLRN